MNPAKKIPFLASLLLISSILLLFPATVGADASEGELFGYKLLDKYPITETTVGKLTWTGHFFEIKANNPVKPDDIDEVRVMVTLKSSTIIHIYSHTEFDAFKEAKDFVWRYAAILEAKYSQHDISPFTTDLNFEVLNIHLQKNYWLYVGLFEAERDDKKHSVQIGLRPTGKLEKETELLGTKERDQRILEQAEGEDKLRGF